MPACYVCVLSTANKNLPVVLRHATVIVHSSNGVAQSPLQREIVRAASSAAASASRCVFSDSFALLCLQAQSQFHSGRVHVQFVAKIK